MRWFVCIPLIFMSLIALPGCDGGTSVPDPGGEGTLIRVCVEPTPPE